MLRTDLIRWLFCVLVAGCAASCQKSAVTHATTAPTTPKTVEQLAREGYAGEADAWAKHSKLLGHPAPPLPLTDWHGTPVTDDARRGKIVVVDFWATWCGPCIANIPHNNELARKFRDRGVLFVGACGGGEEEKMKDVADVTHMAYPTGKASEATTQAWGVEWWPHYAVVDRKGNLRGIGLDPDYLERIIERLLAE
jgi:thiol-disulfide isomerase/thioredoxin